MEDRARIILTAEKIFAQNGFYKTTMDEIAKDLRISKKTIYKHFNSKDELLYCVMDQIMENLAHEIEGIIAGEYNSVEKLYLLSKTVLKRISKISDKWLDDLRVYKPQLWEEIDKFRTKMATKNILRIIAQGKKEELIIDHPSEIIITIIMSSVQAVINPQFVMNHNISIQSAGKITLDIVFNGILTKKGRKLFRNYKTGSFDEE